MRLASKGQRTGLDEDLHGEPSTCMLGVSIKDEVKIVRAKAQLSARAPSVSEATGASAQTSSVTTFFHEHQTAAPHQTSQADGDNQGREHLRASAYDRSGKRWVQ